MSVNAARERLTAVHADKVRAALQVSVDVDALLSDFQRSHTGAAGTPVDARSWVRVHARTNTLPLNRAVTQMLGDGWVLGQRAGRANLASAAHLQKLSKRDALEALATNWDRWTPGHETAAALTRPPRGLRTLLDHRNVTIQGITDTTLDRLGTVLADSLDGGWNVDQTARALRDVLGDPARSVMIARTELASAMSVASRQEYQDAGVEMVEWLVADPCDVCADNEAASPLPIDAAFPSGDTEPPAHPACLCSLSPYVVDTRGLFTEDIEMVTKAILDRMSVARALARLEVLPNPTTAIPHDPADAVESPWAVVPVPTIDPGVWDAAEVRLMPLRGLVGTNPYQIRRKVRRHIEAMGQALSRYRSYPLIYQEHDTSIIIDGHHRLMAQWLLGLREVPVWFVKGD